MAVTDFILAIEGLEGESRQGAPNETNIDIMGWAWEENSPRDPRSGLAGGKVSMKDFDFTMRTNTASPFLMYACSINTEFPKATLTCRKAGPASGRQEVFLTYILEKVYVTSYRSVGGGDNPTSDGNVIPIDRFTLAFAKLEIRYRRQNPDGSLGGTIIKTWDLRTNR